MTTCARPARPALLAVVGLGLVGLLAGCVTLPTAGPVEQVAPRGPEVDVLVRVVPPGPLVGARPTEVVSGFLTAMQSFPVSTEVAREFLTQEAEQRWAPERQTVVYTSSSVSELRTGRRDARVAVRTAEEARLDGRGSYRPVATGNVLRRSLEVVRTESGWRIADPPDALLLSASFFEEYYRPFDLYFFDPTGTALVADPVWLPLGEQLTTRLVDGLLTGPTRWLRGQAVTTVSEEADVQVAAPLGTDGVVDVKLSDAVTGLSGGQRERLSAQLVWTLSQAPGVEGVQVTADNAPLAVPGVEAVQAVAAWRQYDPSDPAGLGARTRLYGVRGGHVTALELDTSTRLTGWWGGRRRSVAEISVESTLDRIAATDGSRQSLVVGPYTADARAISTWYSTDGTLAHPQWDRTGQLWVLDRRAGGAGRLVVSDDGRPRPVRGALQRAAGLRQFGLSPDGSRIAMLVDRWPGHWRGDVRQPPARGPILVVARVTRGVDGRRVRRLDRAYAVPVRETGLGDLSALAWGAPTELSVLGRLPDEPAQVYRVPVDGSPVEGGILSGEAVLGPVGAVTVTASGVTGADAVVGNRRGRLFALDGQAEWTQFAAGVRSPRYPD